MRGDVAILPFEVQQWLSRSSLLQVHRFHLANHYHMITRRVLSVNLAIQPVQAARNDRITQRRFLPVDTVPFVRASPGELVGNIDLLT